MLSLRSIGIAWISLTLPLAARAESFDLADFESALPVFDLVLGEEFPGATGTLSRESTAPQQGHFALRLSTDFSHGGQYVSTAPALAQPLDLDSLSFWIKSKDVSDCSLRLVDSSGQIHQQQIHFANDNQWHQIVLKEFNRGQNYQHWDGKADGRWHGPAKEIRFILEKTESASGAKASIELDQLSATGRRPQNLALRLASQKLGNIFNQTEPVEVAVEARGEHFTWRLKDWQNTVVAEGKEPGHPAPFILKLPDLPRGFFTLEARVNSQKKTLEAITTLAVLAQNRSTEAGESAFGVCTHFAADWNPELIPLITQAGIQHVRDEIYWEDLESPKGKFTFPPKFERFMAEFARHHLQPLIPLTFENSFHDEGKTPFSSEGFSAYAQYGVEVLRHYPQINALEIWNEYNGDFCKGPARDNRTSTYSKMLAHAYPALKQARPSIPVLGVDTAGVPMPYLEQLFKNGALAQLDIVSVHPYRYRSTPEGIETEISAVAALIRKYNQDQTKPIWATEYGWMTQASLAPGDLAIDENDQAKFLVRGHTLMLSAGLEKAFWYLFKDTPDFPTMGLLRNENDPKGRYTPKPAYVAYATLCFQLAQARFLEREKAGPGVYVLRFETPDHTPVRVLWSLAPLTLKLSVPKPATICNLMGVETILPAGPLELSLTDSPIFLRGPLEGLPIPGALNQPVLENLLADSIADFSNTQGKNNWFYGFYTNETLATERFVQLPDYRVTDWNPEWLGITPWLAVTPTYQHPAIKDQKPITVVRRWVSPISGSIKYSLKAKMEETQGDGVTLRLFVDEKPLLKRKLGGGQSIRADIDSTLKVQPGTKLDFTIDPGPSTNINSDGTSLSITIQNVLP